MMKMNHQHKGESLVYLVLWIVLFTAPIISLHFHNSGNVSIRWNDFTDEWLNIGVIFIIFLLHNYILAPLLIYQRRKMLYFSCLVIIVSCFIIFQCVHVPEGHRKDHFQEIRGEGPRSFEDVYDPMGPPPLPQDVNRSDNDEHGPMNKEGRPDFADKPPIIFGQHDLLASLMLISILGMNIGVKLYFKQRQDERRYLELEKENLHQQLEYLRYQINPHFLMNTLNNIHALVDIDSERAKETIVELSKIMRYALYEGNHQTVPLLHDIAFLKSYIQLMQLRYTEKVSITFNVSDKLPDCVIPPMIFITFVENAFKHGVSYQQESFINISIMTDNEKIVFTCKNSKAPKKNGTHPDEGGVGLQNVKRRMLLIYGKRYDLNIDDLPDTYNIILKLPLLS